MPLSFKEFLDKEAERIKQEKDRVRAVRDEWVSAITRLFHQMTAWIEEVDTSKVLKINTSVATRREPELGPLDVPLLEIWLGNKVVIADPVAYNVVAPGLDARRGAKARGRIDLKSDDKSFKLYRFLEQEGLEYWILIDGATFELKDLTKDAFEAALLDLLQ